MRRADTVDLATADSRLPAILGELGALRHQATPTACRSAAVALERLAREFYASASKRSRTTAPPKLNGRHATETAEVLPPEPVMPEGVEVGDTVLATGLHAGMRKPFKAVLMGVRSQYPPLLVRYTSTVDGRTLPILIPEIISTYLPSSEVSRFDEGEHKKPCPRSAKTRGQQAEAVEAEAAPACKRAKADAKAGKRVRFVDEHGVLLPPIEDDEPPANAESPRSPGSPRSSPRAPSPPPAPLNPTSTDEDEDDESSRQSPEDFRASLLAAAAVARDYRDRQCCECAEPCGDGSGGAGLSAADEAVVLCGGEQCRRRCHVRCVEAAASAAAEPAADRSGDVARATRRGSTALPAATPPSPPLPAAADGWRCHDCMPRIRLGHLYQVDVLALPSPRPRAQVMPCLPSPTAAPTATRLTRQGPMRHSATEFPREAEGGGGGGGCGGGNGGAFGEMVAAADETPAEDGATEATPRRVSYQEIEWEVAATTAARLSSAALSDAPPTWPPFRPRGAAHDDDFYGSSTAGGMLAGRTRLMLPDATAAKITGIRVGAECWARTLSGGGFKEKFRARFLGMRWNGPPIIVRFLADCQGRTSSLCLPTPIVQFLEMSEVETLDAYSPDPLSSGGGSGGAAGGPGADGQPDAKRQSKRQRMQLTMTPPPPPPPPPPSSSSTRGDGGVNTPKRPRTATAASDEAVGDGCGGGGGGGGGDDDNDDDDDDDEACARCMETRWRKGNEMLLCDGPGCDVAFHLGCLSPPLDKVPENDWLCPACAADTVVAAGSVGNGTGKRARSAAKLPRKQVAKHSTAETAGTSRCLACEGRHRPHTCRG